MCAYYHIVRLENFQLRICLYITILMLFGKDMCFIPGNNKIFLSCLVEATCRGKGEQEQSSQCRREGSDKHTNNDMTLSTSPRKWYPWKGEGNSLWRKQ